jgi:hypothetical protein
MTLYQRRFFALAIFAFSFIVYYEARGRRLLSPFGGEERVADAAWQAHYWQQVSIATFVLVLGGLLFVLLRRRSRTTPYPVPELIAYALGLGVLIGTAYVSWVACHA